MNQIVQFHAQSEPFSDSTLLAEIRNSDSTSQDVQLCNWRRELRSYLPLRFRPSNPILEKLTSQGFIHIKGYIDESDLFRLSSWAKENVRLNSDKTFAAILPPQLSSQLHIMLGVVPPPNNNTHHSILDLSQRYLTKAQPVHQAISDYLRNDPICIGNQLVHWTNIFTSKGAGYWHRDLGGTLLKAYFCISATKEGSYPFDIVPFPLLDPTPRAYELTRPSPLEELITHQDFRSINLSAGDLLVFDTNCIHRGRYFEQRFSSFKHHRTIMQVFLTNKRVEHLVRENPFHKAPMHKVVAMRNRYEWNQYKIYSFPDAETAADMELSAELLKALSTMYTQATYL